MPVPDDPTLAQLRDALSERTKELNCVYSVDQIFNQGELAWAQLCQRLLEAIPKGWRYPERCQVHIRLGQQVCASPGWTATPWQQRALILVQGEEAGEIVISYTEAPPNGGEDPFLAEEQHLLETIAARFGRHIHVQRLTAAAVAQNHKNNGAGQWQVIIDMLRRTNPRLLMRITRKMLNLLCQRHVTEAEHLLESFGPAYRSEESVLFTAANAPRQYAGSGDFLDASQAVFAIAADHLPDHEIAEHIQRWITEDRTDFLANILEIPGASLQEVVSALQRFQHLVPRGLELSPQRETAFKASLGRRFFSDQPQFINIVKRHVTLEEYGDLTQRLIMPPNSHGRLGGKAAGMILAESILTPAGAAYPILQGIRTPRTWYLASDGILHFLHFNNLEDIVEQKYKEIDQVRQEYPFVVQLFKNSPMPPDLLRGLAVALDNLSQSPLIVRSSSLLEDRLGAAFAGKYKSVFIANQGTKEERLRALADAIAEVYASTFGPDPIEYRARHELVDLHEEMGVLIQEVVGTQVGPYFLPAFAGVAFSTNDFRWSPRLQREDGLVRMVPGLGTRAVDRVATDYPILFAPGRPGLRINITPDEKMRYAPRKIDVINLVTNAFETVDLGDLLRRHGRAYPLLHQLASVRWGDNLHLTSAMTLDAAQDELVITGDGLIERTAFVEQIRTMLQVLQEQMQTPVDVEFAHDGRDFYLLQCRAQSYAPENQPATIPNHLSLDDVLFSAHRFVSNGIVSNITHLVYVDPWQYQALAEHEDLVAVGRAVSQLNRILPARRFILIGPGRWGSRGDIKLGVSVTFSDIDNAAMLIEIADGQREFGPELSFGTHFFLDLVESRIRYLPLYPHDPETRFHAQFLTESANVLPDLLPDFAHLAAVVRVIDLPKASRGRVLHVYMNAEKEKAVGVLGGVMSW